MGCVRKSFCGFGYGFSLKHLSKYQSLGQVVDYNVLQPKKRLSKFIFYAHLIMKASGVCVESKAFHWLETLLVKQPCKLICLF